MLLQQCADIGDQNFLVGTLLDGRLLLLLVLFEMSLSLIEFPLLGLV